MSWQELPIGDGLDGVTLTVTKTRVSVRLGRRAIAGLMLFADASKAEGVWPKIGSGEHAGLMLLEPGSLPPAAKDTIDFHFRTLTLPGLPQCRALPLAWSAGQTGIEIRLPQTAGPRPASRGVPRPIAAAPDPDMAEQLITLPGDPDDDAEFAPPSAAERVAVPAQYADLHRQAWGIGLEMTFLSDGTCAAGGEVLPVKEMERLVKRRLQAHAGRHAPR